jgi:hypothetical protein
VFDKWAQFKAQLDDLLESLTAEEKAVKNFEKILSIVKLESHENKRKLV